MEQKDIQLLQDEVRSSCAPLQLIRSEVGRRLSLRHVPQMIFYATDSIEYSAAISNKLRELNKEAASSDDEE